MAKKKKAAKKLDTATTRRYRDARTGRFVTKKYAKKHRKTTVKESATKPVASTAVRGGSLSRPARDR